MDLSGGRFEMSKKKGKRGEDLGYLHVTLISLAMDQLSLSLETEMTKAALLYADKVTIASPRASMLSAFASLTLGDERQQMRTLAQLAGVLPGGEVIPGLVEHLLSRKHYSREELLALGQLRGSARELERVVERQLEEAGAAELAPAIESGVVEIDLLGVDEMGEEGEFDIVLEHLTSLMERTVSSSSTSHPLFDSTASGYLKALIDGGIVEDVALGPATEIGVARALITNLEAFPQASMDVVLDVRERLRDPLIRFRAAMGTMSRETRETPLGPAFESEIRRLYMLRVEPSLLEIRELMDELGVRPTLARGTASALPPALISFLVGAGLGAPDWIKLGSLGGTAVAVMAREYLKRRDVTASARSNEVFFLYAADADLARH